MTTLRLRAAALGAGGAAPRTLRARADGKLGVDLWALVKLHVLDLEIVRQSPTRRFSGHFPG